MSALGDVARLAEVSPATASRALTGRGYVAAETRQRVVAAAAAVGYLSSPTSSIYRSPSVGILVSDFTAWFSGAALEGIESTLASSDYELAVHRLGSDPGARRKVLGRLLGRGDVAAVIALRIELRGDEASLLRSIDRPVMAVGARLEGIESVAIDDRTAAEFVTGHLISLGHENISHVGGGEHGIGGTHAERHSGFQRAMENAGLTAGPVMHVSSVAISDGHAAGLVMLADPRTRPTAVVAGTDELAIGVILAARQLGIAVPEQLSVVGIDGHDLAEVFSLTTLAHDPREQGSAVARRVLARLSGDGPWDALWTPAAMRLEVRGSTRAPAHTVTERDRPAVALSPESGVAATYPRASRAT